jgi:hypothetical protein
VHVGVSPGAVGRPVHRASVHHPNDKQDRRQANTASVDPCARVMCVIIAPPSFVRRPASYGDRYDILLLDRLGPGIKQWD